jgi:hypothetical protein
MYFHYKYIFVINNLILRFILVKESSQEFLNRKNPSKRQEDSIYQHEAKILEHNYDLSL